MTEKKKKDLVKLTSLDSMNSETRASDVDKFKTDGSNFASLLMSLPKGKKNLLKFERTPVEEQFGKDVKIWAKRANPILILSPEDKVLIPSKFDIFTTEFFRQLAEKKEQEDSGITPDLYLYMDQRGIFREAFRVKSESHRKELASDGKMRATGEQTTGSPIDRSNFKKYKDAFLKLLSEDILLGGEFKYKETAKNEQTGKSYVVERTVKYDKPFTILLPSELVDDVKVTDKETGKTYFKGRRLCYPINPTFWDLWKKLFSPMCMPLGTIFIQGKNALSVMFFLYRHRKMNSGPMKIIELCRLVGFPTNYSKTINDGAKHFRQNTRKPLEEVLKNSVGIGLQNYTLKDSSGNVMTTETPNETWIKGFIHFKTLVKPRPDSIAQDGNSELDSEDVD